MHVSCHPAGHGVVIVIKCCKFHYYLSACQLLSCGSGYIGEVYIFKFRLWILYKCDSREIEITEALVTYLGNAFCDCVSAN